MPRKPERFLQSKHVRELKLIALIAVMVLIPGGIILARAYPDEPGSLLAFAGVCAGIIGWCYRSASARLGVVDLCAAEISSLCRTIMRLDLAAGYYVLFAFEHETHSIGPESWGTHRLDRPPLSPPAEVFGQVFFAKLNEIAFLELDTIRKVTEFYTLFETMRGFLRVTAEYEQANKENIDWGTLHALHDNTFYASFLSFEAARLAIGTLVEIEEHRTESEISILLSEIIAYHYLLSYDYLRARELRQKWQDYEALLARIIGCGYRYKRLEAATNDLAARWHFLFRLYSKPPLTTDFNYECLKQASTVGDLINSYKEFFPESLREYLARRHSSTPTY